MHVYLKKSAKNALIYGLGNVSQRLVGFLLIPVYTAHFTVSEYGVLGILEVSALIFIAFLGFGLDKGFSRWYWDDDYKNVQKKIFFTIFIFLGFISVIFISVVVFFSDSISIILFDTISYSYCIKLISITSMLQLISLLPETLLKLQERPGLFTIVQSIKFFITLLFSVYFIVYLNKNIESIFEAQIIGYIFFYVILLIYIRRNIELNFMPHLLKLLLNYSVPLALTAIVGILYSVSDRYLLKFLIDVQEVGLYSLAFKVSFSIRILVINSIQMAISPYIFKMMNDHKNNKLFYTKIMTYFSLIVMCFVLFISLYSKELIHFIAHKEEYWAASSVVPVLALSIYFGMLKDTAAIGLHITKKTKIIAVTFLLANILNLVLNIVLIPLLESMGAALATFLSQIALFISIYVFAQKSYHIPYEMKKIIMLPVFFILIFISSMFFSEISFTTIVYKLFLIILFPVLLFISGFFDANEIDKMKKIKSLIFGK